MSRRVICYDNAVAEIFFIIKTGKNQAKGQLNTRISANGCFWVYRNALQREHRHGSNNQMSFVEYDKYYK